MAGMIAARPHNPTVQGTQYIIGPSACCWDGHTTDTIPEVRMHLYEMRVRKKPDDFT